MKSTEKKNLTEKESLFCYHYISTGNVREAATLAGYDKDPEKRGMKLLSRGYIKNEVDRLYNEKKRNMSYKAYMGYERLAFGSVADAIRLLYADKLDRESLEGMDLFGISEIKRPKEGAMEIKFFDRLRALEKLEQGDYGNKNEINPFYYALEQSIKSINNTKDRQEEDSGDQVIL